MHYFELQYRLIAGQWAIGDGDVGTDIESVGF